MPTWSEMVVTLEGYWPFIAKVIVIWYLGQVFKKRVWTKARSDRYRWASFARDTLPVHPLVAGAIWGALFPLLPSVALVSTRGAAICEGLLAGTVAVAGFTALEHYAERKRIVWLLNTLRGAVPDDSVYPPAPPPLGTRKPPARRPPPTPRGAS